LLEDVVSFIDDHITQPEEEVAVQQADSEPKTAAVTGLEGDSAKAKM